MFRPLRQSLEANTQLNILFTLLIVTRVTDLHHFDADQKNFYVADSVIQVDPRIQLCGSQNSTMRILIFNYVVPGNQLRGSGNLIWFFLKENFKIWFDTKDVVIAIGVTQLSIKNPNTLVNLKTFICQSKCGDGTCELDRFRIGISEK